MKYLLVLTLCFTFSTCFSQKIKFSTSPPDEEYLIRMISSTRFDSGFLFNPMFEIRDSGRTVAYQLYDTSNLVVVDSGAAIMVMFKVIKNQFESELKKNKK